MPRRIAPHSDARHTPTPSDHIRELARRVARLGHGSRQNCVGRFVVEKVSIERELEMVARDLEPARGRP